MIFENLIPKIEKITIVIENIDLDRFKSFNFSDDTLFIADKNSFPLMKYIVPAHKFLEFDGDGDKFDFENQLLQSQNQESISIEAIPTKGWVSIDWEGKPYDINMLIMLSLNIDENWESFIHNGDFQVIRVSPGFELPIKTKEGYRNYFAIVFQKDIDFKLF